MAAMKEPVEDSDDENGDADDFEADGPFWQLFDHLYNSASATGIFSGTLNYHHYFNYSFKEIAIYFI